MKVDLKKMSRKELQKLAKDVDAALAKIAEEDKKAALAAIEKAAAQHGFSVDELTGTGKKKGAKKSASKPKYRNPNNAAETWSGRGRKPKWVVAIEADGQDLTNYLI